MSNADIKFMKRDYFLILEEYLGKSESEDLLNEIFSEYSSINASPNQASNSLFIRSAIDRIITYTKEKLTSKKHLNLLLNLAKLSLSRGELFISHDIFSQVMLTANYVENSDNETAEAYMGLGELSSMQAKWEESFSNVRKAKKLFERTNNVLGLSRCDNLLGAFYAERGVLNSAEKHFKSGLERLKGRRSKNLDAMILVNLGILNNIIGKSKEAEKNYKKALAKFEKNNELKLLAETRHNLGMLFTKTGDYKSALAEFNLCIKIASKDQNLFVLAISYLSKAYIYAEQNKLKQSVSFIEKGMEIASKINDRLTIADLYKVKGIVERKKNNFALSESYLLTSLRINNELGNKLNYSETSYELGLLYLEQNQPQKAKKHLKLALNYFNKIEALPEIEKIKAILQ